MADRETYLRPGEPVKGVREVRMLDQYDPATRSAFEALHDAEAALREARRLLRIGEPAEARAEIERMRRHGETAARAIGGER